MLYLVTNRKLVKKGTFLSVIEAVISGGVDGIILREKDLNDEELLSLSILIKDYIGDRDIQLCINSNLAVAKEINASGYHSSFEDFIRRDIDYNGILGVSIHSKEEAVKAERKKANYLLAGHIFETDCKMGLKPRGTQWLKEIVSNCNIPVIAIGGINKHNAMEVLKAGAIGFAVMSEIMSSEDPESTTAELKKIMESHVK